MAETGPGLRERKKQRTRETIIERALALFGERGFDATTVGDIAEAADIAPRTFFAYFATKEDVVFHDFETFLAGLRTAMLERSEGETAFDALRTWVAGQVAEGVFGHERDRDRRLLVAGTPALATHERANMARVADVIAEAVARDLGAEPDGLRARLVSAAAVAALDALGRHDAEGGHADPEDAMPVLDEALAFLNGGLEALRRHDPAG